MFLQKLNFAIIPTSKVAKARRNQWVSKTVFRLFRVGSGFRGTPSGGASKRRKPSWISHFDERYVSFSQFAEFFSQSGIPQNHILYMIFGTCAMPVQITVPGVGIGEYYNFNLFSVKIILLLIFFNINIIPYFTRRIVHL